MNNVPTGGRVVFDLAEWSVRRTAFVRLLAGINRYDVSIMDGFEIGGQELADLLNEWQQQYGGGGAGRRIKPKP